MPILKITTTLILILAGLFGFSVFFSCPNYDGNNPSKKMEENSTVVFRIENPGELHIGAAFQIAAEVPYKIHDNYDAYQGEWSLLRKIVPGSPICMYGLHSHTSASDMQTNLKHIVSHRKKIKCITLCGNQVSKLHLELTGKVLGLECLVLDSCALTSPVLKQFQKSHPRIKILHSQSLYIKELNGRSPAPTRILLEKLAKESFECIDDEHFYRVVEICRNRQAIPVWGPPIDESIVKSLPYLTTLRSLDLSEANVDNEFLAKLSDLKSLEILRLDKTKIDEKGLKKLSLVNISRLNLSETAVSGRLPPMPNLELLDLSSTKISDDFCSDALLYPRLRALDLSETLVTKRGIQSCLAFKNLSYLTLDKKWSEHDSMLGFTEKGVEIKFVEKVKERDWSE